MSSMRQNMYRSITSRFNNKNTECPVKLKFKEMKIIFKRKFVPNIAWELYQKLFTIYLKFQLNCLNYTLCYISNKH